MSTLLCGQNALLIDERLAAILADLDPNRLNTTVIDVQTSSIEAISSAVLSTPFFGGQRVVVLREPLAQQSSTDDSDAEPEDGGAGRVRWPDLARVLKDAPATTEMIVTHHGKLSSGHYARKALEGAGWKVEQFDIPRGADMLAWVSARATSYGYRFAPGAAERLLDLLYPLTGRSEAQRTDTTVPDPRLIANEVEKLALAAEDGIATEQHVERLVADRSGYQAFELSNRLFSGQTEAALAELDRTIEAGEAPERILAQLAAEVAAVSHSRMATQYDAKDVAAAGGISDGRVRMLINRRIDSARLASMAEEVRAADEAVKRGHAPLSLVVIAPLVARLALLARTPDRRR